MGIEIPRTETVVRHFVVQEGFQDIVHLQALGQKPDKLMAYEDSLADTGYECAVLIGHDRIRKGRIQVFAPYFWPNLSKLAFNLIHSRLNAVISFLNPLGKRSLSPE